MKATQAVLFTFKIVAKGRKLERKAGSQQHTDKKSRVINREFSVNGGRVGV